MHAELLSVAVCVLLSQAPKQAATSPSPSKPGATAPAQSDAKSTNPAKPSGDDLEVRYARAQLQMAEANLKRMNNLNEKQPRSVPVSILEEFRQDVELAKSRLKQAESGAAENAFQTWLRRAELAWQTAETGYKNGMLVNQRTPGTFTTLDIDRYRLRAEIARLQYERGLALVDAPRESQLQWEVELLNGEIQRLKEQTTRMPALSRFYAW